MGIKHLLISDHSVYQTPERCVSCLFQKRRFHGVDFHAVVFRAVWQVGTDFGKDLQEGVITQKTASTLKM
jgi:hypothetical protein